MAFTNRVVQPHLFLSNSISIWIAPASISKAPSSVSISTPSTTFLPLCPSSSSFAPTTDSRTPPPTVATRPAPASLFSFESAYLLTVRTNTCSSVGCEMEKFSMPRAYLFASSAAKARPICISSCGTTFVLLEVDANNPSRFLGAGSIAFLLILAYSGSKRVHVGMSVVGSLMFLAYRLPGALT